MCGSSLTLFVWQEYDAIQSAERVRAKEALQLKQECTQTYAHTQAHAHTYTHTQEEMRARSLFARFRGGLSLCEQERSLSLRARESSSDTSWICEHSSPSCMKCSEPEPSQGRGRGETEAEAEAEASERQSRTCTFPQTSTHATHAHTHAGGGQPHLSDACDAYELFEFV